MSYSEEIQSDGIKSEEIKTVKTSLRRSLLQQRTSLSLEDWRVKSDRLCHHLRQWQGLQQASTVLSYVSFRQEPDLHSLIQSTPKTTGKVWGLPRCVERHLYWHRWEITESLHPNRYGILEPHESAPLIAPEQVEVMLVPAVACDHNGYRLGYGGGFYDRLLSRTEWSHVLTIGIVFEEHRVPALPVASWDRPLHGVCTEAGLFLHNGSFPESPAQSKI
jgi:5-formyltetrahydrofolate cyclo-ligase